MEKIQIEKGKTLPGGMLFRSPAYVRIGSHDPYTKTIPQAIADYLFRQSERGKPMPDMDQIVYMIGRLDAKAAFRQAHRNFLIPVARPELSFDVESIYEELRLGIEDIAADAIPPAIKKTKAAKKKK